MGELRGALLRALIISTITLSASKPALAEPITWWVSGDVHASGIWVDVLPPGTRGNLTMTWEPDTISVPYLNCPPGSGVYQPFLNTTVSTYRPEDDSLIFEARFYPLAIFVNAPELGTVCGPEIKTGVEIFAYTLLPVAGSDELFGTVHRIFVDPEPTDPTALDLYGIFGSTTHAGFSLHSYDELGGFQFSGPIYASRPLERPIPEPGSLVLLGTGLLGAAAWRRRRNGNGRKDP